MKIPFFKQDVNYSCGPAVIQMVLKFYGKFFSEEELMKRLKTNKNIGTRHEDMIDVTTKEGFYVYSNNGSSFQEIDLFLKEKKPIVVNFIEPNDNEGHYSVVVGLNDEDIILNDPWNGPNFKMKKTDFEKRWFSEDGRNNKWIMVVSDKDFALGKQYLPKK
jgi:predicted double-glycine peptidase